MSWLRIRTKRGVIKIKPKWQMRSAELAGRVPVINLGLFVISYWNKDAQKSNG